MSHFSLIVFSKNKNEVDELMQPYHQFECTDTNDKYIQEIDELSEAKELYEVEKCSTIKCPNGTEEFQFNSEGDYKAKFRKFYNEETQKLELPENYILLKDRLTKDCQTFLEWAQSYYMYSVVNFNEAPDKEGEHKYGWIAINKEDNVVEIINRTNPKAQWDYWSIGGRWTGLLTSYNPTKDDDNLELCSLCNGTGTRNDDRGKANRIKNRDYTCNGCDGKGTSVVWSTRYKPYDKDQLKICDIPLKEVQNLATDKAAKLYDKIYKITEGKKWHSWEQLQSCNTSKDDIDLIRERYNMQPAIYALNKSKIDIWDFDEFLVTREEYIELSRLSVIVPFAYILNGKWYERGSMNWFGIARDEEDKLKWSKHFMEVLNAQSPNTIVTVVDCHI